jgi:glycosidase
MFVALLPRRIHGAARELHISRYARARFGVPEVLFTVRGTVLFADVGAARQLAARMNEAREARLYPELAVRAGELFAAGLIHEVQHLVLAAAREEAEAAGPVATALAEAGRELGEERLRGLLERFSEEFPTVGVGRAGVSPADYLAGESAGVPNREVVLEEMVLLWLANRNPALERFRELFDDGPLEREGGYLELVQALGKARSPFAHKGPPGASQLPAAGPTDQKTLLDLLQAPATASPTSLEGQLEYIRNNWQPLLGGRLSQLLDRVLLGLDLLAEERKPGFDGPGPSRPAPTVEELRRSAGRDEPERFSSDASWMPGVVLLAKSTYVWLDQLSQRHGRQIRRLDQIPDEELDELAARGFSGLWLIGLWERSEASRRIKHLRGQSDAVASAYALHDYRIADDLGGEGAYRSLSERASERGIRLASDIVPNHVGIDGRWVVEHPDWFVQLDHSPYPGYSFDGPDLSSDERVGVFLEDHYYDGSDAAVVFKRLDRKTREERFIYHGNDGTAMPWNDTAQLDYLKAEVREAVIQTILHVARLFPIIRFDAAMTLAKQHVQRLWFPEPGTGGAIASRSQYGAMSDEEFERAMPREFWRDVVDRVEREAPGTLLLAEAFWMMEGYFVRTLGMHRVYNSAFMNMLKREENGEFRQLVKNVLEFDPRILGRFVNFMNNPDEESAAVQFGKDDKYFGVCTLMCTMPGLPMFGHGQVDGLEEKYGMEFRRPRLRETPDPWLLERHRREIFPLLHRRDQFVGVEGFRFHDFVTEDGSVNDDVIAYSNLVSGAASLVLFHNRYAQTSGRIGGTASGREPAANGTESNLIEALGLKGGRDRFVVYRDSGSGLEHLARADDLRERGLTFRLEAYRYQVLLEFREVGATVAEPYAELCRELAGRGVPTVHDAVRDLHLRPLFDVFGDLLDTPLDETEASVAAYADFLDGLEQFGYRWGTRRDLAEQRFAALLAAHGAHAAAGRAADRSVTPAARTGATVDLTTALRQLDTALLSWMALEPLERGTYERFRLEQELSASGHSPAEPFEATLFAEVVPLLLEHAESARGAGDAAELLSLLLADSRTEPFLRFHDYEGERFFDREAYRLLAGATALAASILELAASSVSEGLADLLAELRAIEEDGDFRVSRLREAARITPRHPTGLPAGER